MDGGSQVSWSFTSTHGLHICLPQTESWGHQNTAHVAIVFHVISDNPARRHFYTEMKYDMITAMIRSQRAAWKQRSSLTFFKLHHVNYMH